MNRKDHRKLLCGGKNDSNQLCEPLRVVHIARPVKRNDSKTVALEPKASWILARLNRGFHHLERIDHDVSDELDSVFWNSLSFEVLIGVRRRRPQEICERIGCNSVQLFRHRSIAAAQPCFEVTNRNPDFLGRQSTGDRGIYVAHDDHPIRPLLQARFLIRDHDTTRLLRMSAAAYPQMDVGVGKAELPQEGT